MFIYANSASKAELKTFVGISDTEADKIIARQKQYPAARPSRK
ncbi:hypothetical protein [Polaromonas sp. UBA4122]|nr:hypothetical protein [Polaromonas sp. UBA4122]